MASKRSVWWRIAFRNLLRNRRRTLITAGGLGFGYMAAVIGVSINKGIIGQMVENATAIVSGQIQIHAADYEPERMLHATLGGGTLSELDAFLGRVVEGPGIRAAAPRVFAGGMIAADDETIGTSFLGVWIDRETEVSRLLDAVERGRLPERGELLLGSRMASKLDVEPGDEVVLVAPAADGSLGNELFIVSGIFRTGMMELDANTTVLRLDDLQRLVALPPGEVHEVAAVVGDPWAAPTIAAELRASLGAAEAGMDIRAWTEFQPQLLDFIRISEANNGMVIIVIFFMAMFGVANTMLIATFERRREFAVVRALGASRARLGRAVVQESFTLGVLALAGGALLTFPILAIWRRAPLDISGIMGDITVAGTLIRPVLQVDPTADVGVFAAVVLLVTAVVAGIYPAYRVMRIPPADALADR